MNDWFLSILVAKIEVWISVSILWLPKCRPYIQDLTEKVPRGRAVRRQLSTLDSSHRRLMRTMSGACDGEGCWSWCPCICSDAVYADADYVIDSRHPRWRRSSPYATTNTSAPQQRLSVIDGHLPTWTLCIYGILVTCRQPISAHAMKRDSIRWLWLQLLVCCIGADSAISVTRTEQWRVCYCASIRC